MRLLSRVIFVGLAGIVVVFPFSVVINRFLHRVLQFPAGGQSMTDVLLAVAAMLLACFLASAALLVIIFAGAIVHRLALATLAPDGAADEAVGGGENLPAVIGEIQENPSPLPTHRAAQSALGIAADEQQKELSERTKQVEPGLARMQDPSHTKAYVLRGLAEKLRAFIGLFSDQSGNIAKVVSSLPDPLCSLYLSILVIAEILYEDVTYHAGYYLGTVKGSLIVAFDKQVSSAMERTLSLLAKAEYESGFEEMENEWGKALLQMHNWRQENTTPKTRFDFQSLIVDFLEKKSSATDFIDQWENGIWDPDGLADIGYFVAFVRRLLRRHTTSSDRAPFEAALCSLRELYANSPELKEALRSEMWTEKITPEALGMIAMVRLGGRVSKNERQE